MTDRENVTTWQLRELSPKHKQALALLAQGVDRRTIGELCGYVPEYVTWLQRQPLCKAYLAELGQVVEKHLKGLVVRSIEVLHTKLENPAVSDELALGVMNGAAKALGFGAHGQAQQNVQFVVQLPAKAGSSAEWEQGFSRPQASAPATAAGVPREVFVAEPLEPLPTNAAAIPDAVVVSDGFDVAVSAPDVQNMNTRVAGS